MTESGPPELHAGHAEAVGTLADEAAQLLDAFADRLGRLKTSVAHTPIQGGGLGSGAADTAGATDSGEHSCLRWCPICRSADLLQGDRPELAAKLLDAALVVVTTVRSLIPPTEPANANGAAANSTAANGASANGAAANGAGANETAGNGTVANGAAGKDTAGKGAPRSSRPGLQRIDIR